MQHSLLIIILPSLAFPSFAQVDYYMVSEDYRSKMFKISTHVVNAKVIERGRFVRMEEGVFYGSITCEVTESYKGKLKKHKTITVDVVEYDIRPLGGKLKANDEGNYRIGQNYVFFLQKMKEDDFEGNPQYEPVDDLKGIMYFSRGLEEWLREHAR